MIPVRWSARREPLAPLFAVGRGAVARALGQRALEGAWKGGFSKTLVILEGPDLPWVDGVVYLGGRPGSRVFHDTRLQPDVPLDLLERAVAARMPGRVAWLHDPEALVSLGSLEPIDPARLADWLTQ